MGPLPIFGEMSILIFCSFFDWVVGFFFLILSRISCLYYLDTNCLPITSSTNIFFHYIGCLFVLFTVSVPVWKLLSLIRSNMFIFVFISISLGGCCCCLVTKSYLILLDPRDCSPPGLSVHGIFQARILKSVAISFSRGSSWPRSQTRICCIGRLILYHWTTRVAPLV